MSRLIEVWGDTVNSRHMTGSILLGIGIGTPVFLLAQHFFPQLTGSKSLADSYALLVGLLGCLTAAVIAGRLFKPKRDVVETAATLESRRAALDEIAAEGGEWTDPNLLPAAVQEELRSLGLFDVLEEEFRRTKQTDQSTEMTGAR